MGIFRRIASFFERRLQTLEEGPVDAYVPLLRSRNPETRDRAEEVLRRRGGPDEARALVEWLTEPVDDDLERRLQPLLAQLADASLAPEFGALIASEDPYEQYYGLLMGYGLIRQTHAGEPTGPFSGHEEQIREVYELYGLNQPIGLAAAKALAAMGQKEPLLEPTLERLESEDAIQRIEGYELAGEIRLERARPLMEERLRPDLATPERRAIRLALWLLEQPPDSAVQPVRQILEAIADLGSADQEERLQALSALMAYRDETREWLVRHTDDPEPLVQSGVLTVLAWLGEPDVYDPLVDRIRVALSEPDAGYDLHQLVEALGRLGDERSFEFLAELAEEKWPSPLAMVATEALCHLNTNRTREVLSRLAQTGRGTESLLGILRTLDDPAPLLELTRTGSPTLRSKAALALAHVAPDRAGPRIEALLEETSEEEARTRLKAARRKLA